MTNEEKLIKVRDALLTGQNSGEAVELVNDILYLMDKSPSVFIVTDNMCLALQHYFLQSAGYISHEHHPDVHKFTGQLDEYITKNKLKGV